MGFLLFETVYNCLQDLPMLIFNFIIKLGIPIDRVPTSRSCVFCIQECHWSRPNARISDLKQQDRRGKKMANFV